MLMNRIAVVAYAILISTLTAGAQGLPGPCSLLTRSEVGAVIGKELKTSVEMDTTLRFSPFKGQAMSVCTWSIGADGAGLSVMRSPQDGIQGPASGETLGGLLMK